MVKNRGAGWTHCPACGGPLPAGELMVVSRGEWDFRVICGPAGPVLLPRETDSGRRLFAACEQLADYISSQHMSSDGYDIAVSELGMALIAAFQIGEPGQCDYNDCITLKSAGA
jgi:hypothetical protein